MKLPFWMIPGHWGLRGKSKEYAKIDYFSTTPLDAELARAELIDDVTDRNISILRIKKRYNLIDDFGYEFSMFQLQNEFASTHDIEVKRQELCFKYNLLSEREYEQFNIDLLPDGKEKEKAAIELLYKYREISDDEYNKSIYTINEKVWWKLTIESTEDGSAEIELNYNEHFVKHLKDTGHPGIDEGEIVDFYVKDLGRKLATGDLSDDESYSGTEIPKLIIHGTSNADGTVDYS